MDALETLLRQGQHVGDDVLLALLMPSAHPGERGMDGLHQRAREVTRERFGRRIYLRALIEWSNVCRNDCYYCGIRKSNRSLRRYTLGREDILVGCEAAWRQGLRTFVLQGGENPAAAWQLAPVVAEMRASWPDSAITLSLGELPYETYALLRRSGADRYLLRHETASPAHYARLHPAGMRLESRLATLRVLKELGFQTGMGMMVGSPYQRPQDLVADLRLLTAFRPEMVGIGPFIPQENTPFSDFPPGDAATVLRLYSIVRLLLPDALIPCTTALSTLLPEGRMAGLEAGANVLMPVFTPSACRADYALYDGKDRPGRACAENLAALKEELSAAGYEVLPERGDFTKH